MLNIVVRLGRHLFSHAELKQAYYRLYDGQAPLLNHKSAVLYLLLRIAHAFGLTEQLHRRYLDDHPLTPVNAPPFNVYDRDFLHLRLNRIYDLPEVALSANRPRTINVLVPAFDFKSMSAGFFGVFQVARFLRSTGINVRLVMFDNFYFDASEFRAQFKAFPGMENLLDEVEVDYIGDRRSPLQVSPDDLSVATVWYSAYLAEKIDRLTGAKHFIYLIQDYETNFHPANSHFALADATYDMNYYALFSSESLMRFFIERNIGGLVTRGLKHTFFNNACASSLPSLEDFQRLNEQKPRKSLVFYSRPVVDRNMFELAALVLVEAFTRGIISPDTWDCYGMGLGEGVLQLLPKVRSSTLPRMTLSDYMAKLPEFDVCLTLMASPHPSLIPMDLAGSGAVVVTNTFRTKTSEYLEDISRNIIPAEANLEDLIAALGLAVARSSDLQARHRNAEEMKYPRSWSNSFAPHHLDFALQALAESHDDRP